MVFSTNQVRQFFVVKGNKTRTDFLNSIKAKQSLTPGDTALQEYFADAEKTWGSHNQKKAFEFLYVNAIGQLMHSDLMPEENIRKVKFTPASKLVKYPQAWKVENKVSTGTAEDEYTDKDTFYINFEFPGFLNATDEEIETKTVCFDYDSTKGSWADQMKNAIDLAFNSRNNLDNELIEVEVSGNDAVIITAKEGKWIKGTYNNKPNQVIVSNLTYENNHTPGLSPLPLVTGSKVKSYNVAGPEDYTGKDQNKGIKDGKITADLEYFCMGERGDIYRNVGWPNVIYTKYMIDEAKEYDYLDVHFYYQGEGVRDDKSEKVLTLVCESGTGLLDDFYKTLCGTASSNTQTPSNPSTGGNTGGNSGNNGGNTGGNGDTTGGDPGTSTGTGND